jgi:hypothetical protein
MSRYKNVGTQLKSNEDGKGSKNPQNLLRYGNQAPRTSKSNLTRGAFGNQRAHEDKK